MTDDTAHTHTEITKGCVLCLRLPFADEVVGKLPANDKRPELDYVGHAAVTDRLLTIDPEWSWEPFAVDNDGLPALDESGGLWIRLTICGLTRIGYGDTFGQVRGPKVAIGDAIRNAAMRFGVALDLWSKDELESLVGNETISNRKSSKKKPPASSTSSTPGTAQKRSTARTDPATAGLTEMSARDRNKLIAHLARELKITEPDRQVTKVNEVLGFKEGTLEWVPSLAKLQASHGSTLFAELDIPLG